MQAIGVNIMKKIILIAFVIAFCLTLISCNVKEEFNGGADDIPNTPAFVEMN